MHLRMTYIYTVRSAVAGSYTNQTPTVVENCSSLSFAGGSVGFPVRVLDGNSM